MINDAHILSKCPLCGSADVSSLYEITRFSPAFQVFVCAACAFQFTNPRPAPELEKSFYEEGYYLGNAEYTYTDERKNEKFNRYVWDARLRKIRSFVPRGAFLDIGCSFGGLVKCASQYYESSGVESSTYAYRDAINRGLIVENASAENMSVHENSKDVITMIEVLEHTRDPIGVINNCYRILRKNGVFVIQTADMNSWQAINAGKAYHYYLPGHLSYFNECNITMALKKAGFQTLKIFRPVDFGLLPKLLKMRGSFTKLSDYLRMLPTSVYHFKGFFRKKKIPLTASMVVYAFK